MTAIELLVTLERLGVSLSLDGELLTARAPKGLLSNEVATQLRVHKSELTTLLLRRRMRDRIEPRDADLALETSSAQKSLWFLSQLDGVSVAYHMAFCVRLFGPLDRTVLRRALGRVLLRHETLRSVFDEEGGEVRPRIVAAGCGFALREHDLGGSTDAESAMAESVQRKSSCLSNSAEVR
jgi:hypothetical protein